jgi:hypothetical protein
MQRRKGVGEITDFPDKVGTVGGKPPTVPDFPDTHPYWWVFLRKPSRRWKTSVRSLCPTFRIGVLMRQFPEKTLLTILPARGGFWTFIFFFLYLYIVQNFEYNIF